ncbi:hypothetical protein AK812_SmicGene11277 [Symbiodinium microadriaticum]|uniref:Uncharacterized protein n=1 Tax=Symbiodinium microadriaticum TaxID=2951 RepID=A0A1Q9EDR1_SYMMI|nr:hypothetical protein AK812_SmicGene11277 [Symbiodinium microadriaticum]
MDILGRNLDLEIQVLEVHESWACREASTTGLLLLPDRGRQMRRAVLPTLRRSESAYHKEEKHSHPPMRGFAMFRVAQKKWVPAPASGGYHAVKEPHVTDELREVMNILKSHANKFLRCRREQEQEQEEEERMEHDPNTLSCRCLGLSRFFTARLRLLQLQLSLGVFDMPGQMGGGYKANLFARYTYEAIAEYLCQSGARVVVTDLLSNQESLRDFAKSEGILEGPVGDVADEAFCARLLDEALRLAGPGGLDGLVNNAGIGLFTAVLGGTDPAEALNFFCPV